MRHRTDDDELGADERSLRPVLPEEQTGPVVLGRDRIPAQGAGLLQIDAIAYVD
jgi:hypothetical protein